MADNGNRPVNVDSAQASDSDDDTPLALPPAPRPVAADNAAAAANKPRRAAKIGAAGAGAGAGAANIVRPPGAAKATKRKQKPRTKSAANGAPARYVYTHPAETLRYAEKRLDNKKKPDFTCTVADIDDMSGNFGYNFVSGKRPGCVGLNPAGIYLCAGERLAAQALVYLWPEDQLEGAMFFACVVLGSHIVAGSRLALVAPVGMVDVEGVLTMSEIKAWPHDHHLPRVLGVIPHLVRHIPRPGAAFARHNAQGAAAAIYVDDE